MYESQRLIVTTPEELIRGIYLMKRDGYRLVQISCTRVADGFELNYSFDRNLEFVNYRVVLDVEDEIVSISRIFSPAFLYENELKDLFGVKISGITIDYEGALYRIAQKTPFKAYTPPQPAFPPAKAAPGPRSVPAAESASTAAGAAAAGSGSDAAGKEA
jgi:ech hydrogenase subunit D